MKKKDSRKCRVAGAFIGCFVYCHAVLGATTVETETHRLKVLRDLVREEASASLRFDSESESDGHQCEGMRRDLLEGEALRAIEPIAVLKQDYYPIDRDWPNDRAEQARIERLEAESERLLGASISRGIRRCAGEPEQLGGRHANYFDGIHMVGAPPFRIYRLRKSVDPYPHAELFFSSSHDPALRHGGDYSWVNLETCSRIGALRKDFVNVDHGRTRTALTYYKGGIAAWSFTPGTTFDVEYVRRIRGVPVHRVCSWSMNASSQTQPR